MECMAEAEENSIYLLGVSILNARWLLVGTKVEFELFNDINEKIGMTYTGEFTEIIGDMDIIIYSPEHISIPPKLSEKILIWAKFFHAIHGSMNFTGTLVRKENTKNGTNLYIKIDDNFQKNQKREYVRFGCVLKTDYRFLKDGKDSEDSIKEAPYKRTVTINISFSGLCMIADKNDAAALNDLVDLIIWLRDDLSIHIQSNIVNILEFGEKRLVGLSFTYINVNDSAALTRFITRSTIEGQEPLDF